MPTVEITTAKIYNAAVEVTGVLTGDKGIPITGYTVEVIPPSGNPISLAINVQSSGGDFEYSGATKDNSTIPDSSSIRVITNRQTKGQKTAEQPSNPLIGFLPQGSYQLSCRNIKVELTCSAENANGIPESASIDLTNLVNPNVWNNNANLEIANGYAPQEGFLPGGSWIQSSDNASVTLTCEAEKRNGGWITASFNLTTLKQANLWNDDGVLRLAE